MKAQLTKAHTHNRVVHDAGDVIDVTSVEYAWLKAHGLVQQFNRQPLRVPPEPTKEDDA
jgi:hypothetical protein